MMHRHSASRRGVALVWVLVILLLAVAASAALAAAASSAQMARTRDRSRTGASDLLHAAQAPILDWLTRHASTISLPPDAASPEVAVLHEVWVAGGLEHELRIAAWDQCGVVPIELLKSGSPLRLTAPPHVLELVDRLELVHGAVPGLDLLSKGQAGNESAFPLPMATDGWRVLGAKHVESQLPVHQTESPFAIGALVATHQRKVSGDNQRDRRRESVAFININTAPIELVAAALRELGRGGLELVIAARMQAKPAPVVAVSGQTTHAGDGQIELIAASHAWGLRIDARVGQVQQSWWAVYARSPRGSWECVQRLAITN